MRLNASQVEKAVQMYQSGHSLAEVGKKFDVSGAAIDGLLTRRSIPKRTLSQAARTLECNHHYFGQPMDEARAYWVGFILADGSVSNRSYGVTKAVAVVLKVSDRKHLEKLRACLNSQHKIMTVNYQKGNQGVRFAVSSSEMVNDLAKFNIFPNKSANHTFSDAIPKDMLHHYFRGYFDGNGGIARHPTSKWIISNVSSKQFLEKFVDWTVQELGGHVAKITFVDGIYRASWSGTHRCKEILDLMYDKATIFLDRKQALYQEICFDAEHSNRGPYNRK